MRTERVSIWKPALYTLVILALGAIPLTFLRSAPVLGAPASGTDASKSVAALNEMSNAFTEIAENASPAVVSIQVEKEMSGRGGTQRGGGRMSPNVPPGLEDFLERFFGPNMPGLQAPDNQRGPGGNQGGGRRVPVGQGTGFIMSSDGYIVTNNHVVGEADSVRVLLADGREFEDVEVIGTDPSTDVALLKVDAEDLPTLPLGDSDNLRVAEWVLAIGSPFGLTHSVTAGIVSAVGRGNVGIVDYADFIQTDAAINPGNSGGPLLNLEGEVVGMNTAILSRTGGSLGIGFAIPINMVRYVKDQLADNGSVQRGYLGVGIQNLSADLAEWFGIDEGKGVVVTQVTEGSAADKAGIQRDDVVVEYDGKPIDEMGSFRSRVSTTKPGEKVELVVVRDGKRLTKTVVLGTRDDEEVADTVVAETPSGKTDLGIQVQNLTDELAERFGYENETGVVITQVDPNSEAAMKRIESGMLVQEVNRQKVKNVGEFREALKKAESKRSVLLLVSDGKSSFYVTLDLDN